MLINATDVFNTLTAFSTPPTTLANRVRYSLKYSTSFHTGITDCAIQIVQK